MSEIKTAGEKLRASATERIDCNQPVTVPEMQPEQCWAQGDIGVVRLDRLPDDAKKIHRPAGGQVAPGTTQGSRHCIPEDAPVTYYQVSDGDPLSDLCLVADGPWTLTHPEHAHCTFEAGTYRLIHQQNEQRQRVID